MDETRSGKGARDSRRTSCLGCRTKKAKVCHFSNAHEQILTTGNSVQQNLALYRLYDERVPAFVARAAER